MPYFNVIMRVDIEKVVEAKDEKEALSKVDADDMMHELKNYSVDEEWIVEKIGE